jgi:hypothetical protein
MAILLLLEMNILLLTAKRTLKIGSITYTLVNTLFFVSWCLLRLLMLPTLLVVFILEYKILSADIGTYRNIGALGVCLQGVLVSMSYYWTFEMIEKIYKTKLSVLK